jgi:hypothetical protein
MSDSALPVEVRKSRLALVSKPKNVRLSGLDSGPGRAKRKSASNLDGDKKSAEKNIFGTF